MAEQKSLESPLVECTNTVLTAATGAAAGVSMRELAFRGYFNVRLGHDEPGGLAALESVLGGGVPLSPNTTSVGSDADALWLGPDEWLVVVETERASSLRAALREALAPHFSAVTDVSGGQTTIRLAGANALDTLCKGCTFDLHPRVFGPGQCAQTQVAKTGALIRPMPSNMPSFEVIVRRSFADYLWRWLRHAASEYGVATY